MKLIIPTAINILTHVNEQIVQNRRRGFDTAIELPSLRRRAYLLVKENGVLPVRDVVDDPFEGVR